MTTVLCVRRGNTVALAADGQVTLGNTVVKGTARKVRTLGDGRVVAGFAGSTADALSLFDKFEAQLAKSPTNLPRAAVEMAKEWRTDKYLRNHGCPVNGSRSDLSELNEVRARSWYGEVATNSMHDRTLRWTLALSARRSSSTSRKRRFPDSLRSSW